MHLPSSRPSRQRRLRNALVGIAALAIAACSSPPTESDIADATVRIEVLSCDKRIVQFSTGVILEGGLVLTVAHAFDNGDTMKLLTTTGQVAGDIVYVDQDRDIALVELANHVTTGLSVGEVTEPGPTRYVSFRDPAGPVVLDATVLRFTQLTLDGIGERQGFELDAPIEQGDSGGPVISSDGQVVGIVFAANRSSDSGWAISTLELIEPLQTIEEFEPGSGWQPTCPA